MKTIIITKELDYPWLHDILPGYHPLLVPLCNKPFIEFFIDFAILAGSTAIRIFSDETINDVESFCEKGEKWGTDISYANSLPSDSLDKILKKNSRFCSNERIMIINNILFFHYNKNADYRSFFASLPSGEVLGFGKRTLSLTGSPIDSENSRDNPPLSTVVLDSVGQYYQLAKDLLQNRLSQYVLPGYNNEAGCYIGRNVVIQKSAEIVKPVIIGNNVQILAGSVIGPAAIIGNNVIIDRKSTVSSSIVMDNTFIGEQLEVERIIASGNVLIDPESGQSLTMEDPHLLSSISQTGDSGTFLLRIVHSCIAASFILILLLPYLLLRPILESRGSWSTKQIIYYSAKPQRKVALPVTALRKKGMLSTLAVFFSLDRFLWLFKVLSGDLDLIGSRLIEVNQESKAHLRPGVFSYAEAEDWPQNDIDSDIVNLYYAVHSNLFKDIAMMQKALFNRIHQEITL
ncbi:MAG: sugar transferase [Chlorobium sp.]|nr:sugar transferase [Chlorobium sp.]